MKDEAVLWGMDRNQAIRKKEREGGGQVRGKSMKIWKKEVGNYEKNCRQDKFGCSKGLWEERLDTFRVSKDIGWGHMQRANLLH